MQSQGVLCEGTSHAPEAGPIGPSPILEPERTIRDATALFTECLQKEWTRQKAPYGFDDALEAALSASEDQTERIFADAGGRAWLAYYLTLGIAGSRPRRKLSEFQALSREQRRQVAVSVANFEPHPTVASAIRGLQRPRRRRQRRHPDRGESAAAAVPNTPSLILQAPTTRSSPPENTFTAPDTADARRETNRMSASNETANSQMATLDSSEHQTASGPLAEYLADVFPPFMCSAIRKNGDSAAVEMVFPYFRDDEKVVCAMSLSILPNKVQYLALKLFGWHLEKDETETFQYLVSEDGGGIAMPGETIVLQGARDKALSDLLGDQVRHAVTASLMRKEEVRQAVMNTRCVRMQISRDPRHDAILTLNLALQEAFLLRTKLYERG